MRVLESTEIQAISGAGVCAGIGALLVTPFLGMVFTVPAVATAPLVVGAGLSKGKTLSESLKNAFFHSTLGIQIGWELQKAAYNW